MAKEILTEILGYNAGWNAAVRGQPRVEPYYKTLVALNREWLEGYDDSIRYHGLR